MISLSNGMRVLVVGQHVYPSVPATASSQVVARLRSSIGERGSSLLEAEADLAGSHRLFALELAHRLDNVDVTARLISYGGLPAYAILLSRRPSVTLVVYRARLKPIAVFYRSRSLVASSRLFRQVYARRGGPGC